MDNKKLINILLKDMLELEELITDIKNNAEFESLEFEFLKTKAAGIRQLVEILKNRNIGDFKEERVIEKNDEPEIEHSLAVKENAEVTEEIKEEEKVEEDIQADIQDEIVEEDIQAEIEDESDEEEETILENEISKIDSEPENIIEEDDSQVDSEEKEAEVESLELKEEELQANEDEIEELDDTDEIDQRKGILGDRFSKDRSVHDMIADEGSKLEDKISGLPLSSLKTSIGINDRFLFIRELFEGDGNAYSDTVNSIDEMKSINEAVAYLRDNLKWKKNETSLKFINLVKRRFINE